jgi:hypothetical protein
MLLQYHARRHPVPVGVWEQVYLRPCPKELVLRNHVSMKALSAGRHPRWQINEQGGAIGSLANTHRSFVLMQRGCRRET